MIMNCLSYIITDDKIDHWSFAPDATEDEPWQFGDNNAADEISPSPPTPPPSPSPDMNLDGHDSDNNVSTTDKENFKYSTSGIRLVQIEILTAGSMLVMDPTGPNYYDMLKKEQNKRKKRKRKEANGSVRPLRL